MKKLILILFLITMSLSAQTTYYISSSDGDDSDNGLTEATAWATTDKLHSNWGSIVAGDSILFKRGDTWKPSSLSGGRLGVITIPNMKTGSRGNPIVFDAYGSGADPIISDENISSYSQVLRSGALGWFEFRNLNLSGVVNFRGADDTGLSLGIDHVTFYNVTFDASPMLTNGVNGSSTYSATSSQVPVRNDDLYPKMRSIRFEYCTFVECTGNGGALNFAPYDSLYIGYSTFYDSYEEGIDIAGGFDHVIEYNKIYGTGVNGMKFHSQIYPLERMIVRGNLIVWTGSLNQYNTVGYGMALEGVTDCQVYNNTVYSPAQSVYFGNRDRLPPVAYYGNFEGNVIRNNIFYGSANILGSWENVTFGDSTMPYKNMNPNLFSDNTFTHNTYYSAHVSGYAFRFGSNGAYPNTSNSYYRSILTNQQSDFVTYWQDETSATEKLRDIDFTDAGWTSYSDPGTYTLVDGSDEINSGTYIAGYTVDLAGNPIVGLPDRGAYEYQSGPASPQLSFSATNATYSSQIFGMGSIQPSGTKSSSLTMTNISSDSAYTFEGITETDDSSMFDITYYAVIGGIDAEITFPYEMPASGVVRADIDFTGSAYTGTKSFSLSIDHNSSVMTDPFVINGAINVTTSSVVFEISGDSTKSFTTTKGAELLTNYDFTNWTNDVPDGWNHNITNESGTNYIEESPIGSLHMVGDGNGNEVKQYNILTVDVPHVYEIKIDTLSSGSFKFDASGTTYTWSSAGTYKKWFEPTNDDVNFLRGAGSGTHIGYVDYFSVKQVTSDYDGSATITHGGTGGTMTCDSIALVTGTNFTLTSASTFSLTSGQTYNLTYEFAPSDTGYFVDTVRIYGIESDNKSSYDIPIEGYFDSDLESSTARINLEYADVFFPDTDTSATSDTTLEIWNDGDALLTIDSITSSSNQFVINYPDGDGDTTLTAGDTLSVSYSFEPTTVGVKTSYIRVYHDGVNLSSPRTVQAQGTATAVSTPAFMTFTSPENTYNLSRDTLDFGSISIGGAVNKSVIWQNDGATTLTGNITQAVGTEFLRLSGTVTGFSTTQDAKDTLIYQFTSSTVGTYWDSLLFYDNATNLDSPHTIIFTGEVLPTDQNYEIDKDGYTFSSTDKGDTSTVTFTITNDGSTALAGQIAELASSDAFTLVNGGSYSTTTTKTFTVQFHPNDKLIYKYQIQVTHNASNAATPQTITIWATGNVPAELTLVPTRYDFPQTALGNSRTATVYAYNAGFDSLVVDSVYLETNSVFTIPDTVGKTLPAQLVENGRFDRSDTLWTLSSASITDKLTFSDDGSASQTLSDLKSYTPYIIIATFSDHTGSGDDLTYNLGGHAITRSSSQYNDGVYSVAMLSGSTTDFSLSISSGDNSTKIDNITVSEYISTAITYTPVEGSSYNTDILYYKHDGTQTNPYPMPLGGYKKGGNFYIPRIQKAD